LFDPRQQLLDSFQPHPQAQMITNVIASAFDAVEPGAAVRNYLQENPLPSARKTFMFGLGKAACAMADALADETSLTDALIITKSASSLTFKPFDQTQGRPVTVIEGNHPIPGHSSLKAEQAAKEFLSQLTKDDLLVCLISGGGSALMTSPRVPLEDLQSLTSALLACGARIDEINTLRRHLDELKGGGLIKFANEAQVVSILLSDVVGDSLEDIASGPTAPDPTTRADALSIIRKYDLQNKIPASIIPALRESLKPDDPIFANVQNTIVASNSIALNAARLEAEARGFQAFILDDELQGEASQIGEEIALQLKDYLQKVSRPFCLLAGGETTVTLKGNGKGGRNQELVLGAVDALAGMENILLLSIATDGEDGPTDAAGAYATGESAKRAESLGLFAADYRSSNDAHSYFDQLGQLIQIGSSGTNVNDLVIVFAFD